MKFLHSEVLLKHKSVHTILKNFHTEHWKHWQCNSYKCHATLPLSMVSWNFSSSVLNFLSWSGRSLMSTILNFLNFTKQFLVLFCSQTSKNVLVIRVFVSIKFLSSFNKDHSKNWNFLFAYNTILVWIDWAYMYLNCDILTWSIITN